MSSNIKNQKDFTPEKFKKVITQYCSVDDVNLELEDNEAFFKKSVTFKGGLEINKLFENKEQMKTCFDTIICNLWKIRNVLVHLREAREDKIILPTKNNDELIKPYLFIIRRLAEKMAIGFKM